MRNVAAENRFTMKVFHIITAIPERDAEHALIQPTGVLRPFSPPRASYSRAGLCTAMIIITSCILLVLFSNKRLDTMVAIHNFRGCMKCDHGYLLVGINRQQVCTASRSSCNAFFLTAQKLQSLAVDWLSYQHPIDNSFSPKSILCNL